MSSIERDAQLLANRIALLKQEEMKTWKKIEETKKRTGEIHNMKKRNEDKVNKVSESYKSNGCRKSRTCRCNRRLRSMLLRATI